VAVLYAVALTSRAAMAASHTLGGVPSDVIDFVLEPEVAATR
jgi:hypothetical protein